MMLKKYKSRYGSFDVMKEKEHWDEHTRSIVEKRISPSVEFSDEQDKILYDVCSILLDDSRPAILQFVVSHFKSKFNSGIGEAQRKRDVPKEAVLIYEGLRDLETYCIQHHNQAFQALDEATKKDVIKKLADGHLPLKMGVTNGQAFLKKLLPEAVAAFYSHPDVWSEIGYAGPAYPRGYVRTELGLTDPWEAKIDET